ncbi:failed axon connections homolog [Liolophura sinensis]|uniref:failed axon connections homolog n=1 Tax=Liolophura sinensis TaxID=3198878 RepID=UPI003158159D
MELFAVVSVASLILGIVAMWLTCKKRSVVGNYPKDTIVLHQIRRGPYAPSISPFCVKLETYLRMSKLKYQHVYSTQMSLKGKVPWIELNGQEIADSEFCIEFLNKKQLHPSTMVRRCAVVSGVLHYEVYFVPDDVLWSAVCYVMRFNFVPDYVPWCLVLYRWVFRVNEAWLEEARIPVLFRWYVSRFARRQTWSQGHGRHSQAEVDRILQSDLQAISEFLGTKPFLLGREPSQVDCAVFGQLSQFKWNMHGCLANTLVTETFPNLSAYCERMKERYWPDWDEHTLMGRKQDK